MFRRILVPLDGSALSERALAVAAQLASAADVPVHLLLVHQRSIARTIQEENHLWRVEEAYLRRIARATFDPAGIRSVTDTIAGRPAESICAYAEEIGADLVVMTSHGRTGFSRLWIGSVAETVVRHARMPVILLRTDPVLAHKVAVRRIVVPLDGSAWAYEVLEPAVAVARLYGAAVELLRVVPPIPAVPGEPRTKHERSDSRLVRNATEELEAIAAPLRAGGLEIDVRVVESEDPAAAILDRSRRCELLAMATHGRGASRLVLGSVVDEMIRATQVAMLVVRPRATHTAPPLITARDVEGELSALPRS